jgi:hypothetical protein
MRNSASSGGEYIGAGARIPTRPVEGSKPRFRGDLGALQDMVLLTGIYGGVGREAERGLALPLRGGRWAQLVEHSRDDLV